VVVSAVLYVTVYSCLCVIIFTLHFVAYLNTKNSPIVKIFTTLSSYLDHISERQREKACLKTIRGDYFESSMQRVLSSPITLPYSTLTSAPVVALFSVLFAYRLRRLSALVVRYRQRQACSLQCCAVYIEYKVGNSVSVHSTQNLSKRSLKVLIVSAETT